MSNQISRRTMLRASGIALSLPLLDAMLPRLAFGAPSNFKPYKKSEVGAQPRILFCYVPNGVNIRKWMPTTSGMGYELSPTLQALAKHRESFSVLTGLGHPNCTGGHSGADTFLTGANLRSVPGKEYTNSISIDQVIAEVVGKKTRIPSLELSDSSGTGGAGHSHTLAFDRNGTPLPAENSPRRMFERLFVPDDAASREQSLKRFAEKKSILDDVMEDAKSLERKLGKRDKQKVEDYLGSVREIEQRVSRLEAWIDVPKPTVESRDLQLNSQPGNGHDRPMWIDVMLELTYLAFVTDTTRVVSFEWSREAGGYGGAGENHHELSHHGGDAKMLDGLARIDQFHLERLARHLDFLKATEEAGKSMLDHISVVYGSGMNSGEGGDHSPKNLPLLVAGGMAWGVKHGQHVAFDQDKHPPLANVWLTLAQKMGVESDKFQDASGTLTELT